MQRISELRRNTALDLMPGPGGRGQAQGGSSGGETNKLAELVTAYDPAVGFAAGGSRYS